MASEGELYATSTAGVVDVPQKRRGKKGTKKVETLPVDPVPSEILPSTRQVSDKEPEEFPTVEPTTEWLASLETAYQAIEFMGHRFHTNLRWWPGK